MCLRCREEARRGWRNRPGPAPGRWHQPLADDLVGTGVGGRGGPTARARLLLVNIFRPPLAPALADYDKGGFGAPRDPCADRVVHGNALIRTAIAQAVGWMPSDVAVEQQVISGRPAAELAGLARGGDLLVLGSRRRGQLRRLARGSVARACPRRADCPVVVVPGERPAA